MNRWKMIFSDIDGTLLDSKNRLTKGTLQMIQALEAAGIPFILSTARSWQATMPVRERIPSAAPMITMGGALIVDGEGRVLQSIGMPLDMAKEIKATVCREWPSVCFSSYCGPRWLVDDPENQWIRFESDITKAQPLQENLESLPPDSQVNKLLCMGDSQELLAIKDWLNHSFPDLVAEKSWDTFLEIQDRTATKGSGVRFLCRRYGIDPADTISFGDNYNDLDMLTTTGLGYAMGNAPDEVKRRVGRVTRSHDEEGVLAILEEQFPQLSNRQQKPLEGSVV